MFKSSAFRPILKGKISSVLTYGATGRPNFGEEKDIGLAIIKLATSVTKSSIRADTSGSQSRAEEKTVDGRILTDAAVPVSIGNRIRLLNGTYRVIEVFPRFDMSGLHHHNQVDLEIWV